jgi:Farnesoic acid 0-methyl transferase
MRRSLVPLMSGLALASILDLSCHAKSGAIETPFSDDFERAELGGGWNATSPEYRIAGGALEVSNAYNHPAWLRSRLPANAVIELDVASKSSDGDIKVELYGDGASYDPDKGSYDSTGYVLIFGGWHNTLSIIARLEEHGAGRKAQRADVKVVPGQRYHFTITRKNGAIDWAIDGKPFLAWTDPEPLAGPTHEYFAVNDWEADVTFDNLHIRPVP